LKPTLVSQFETQNESVFPLEREVLFLSELLRDANLQPSKHLHAPDTQLPALKLKQANQTGRYQLAYFDSHNVCLHYPSTA
jgi:hypothetical protein